jgi:hypothetical protein
LFIENCIATYSPSDLDESGQLAAFTVRAQDNTNYIYFSSSNSLCGIVEKRRNRLSTRDIILTERFEKLFPAAE